MKKFVSMFLALAMCLSVPVFAAEEKPSYDEDYINAKFEELFPEYQEYIRNHDAKVAQAASVSQPMLMNLEAPQIVVEETITRMDGDDAYTLALLSDGGYAKYSIFDGYKEVSWGSDGTQSGTKWTNRKITAYISSGGTSPYTGGMIGDSISYELKGTSGTFINKGNYMLAGVHPNYTGKISNKESSTDSTRVIREGAATYYYVNMEDIAILSVPTYLVIDLNSRDSTDSSSPKISFDFAA